MNIQFNVTAAALDDEFEQDTILNTVLRIFGRPEIFGQAANGHAVDTISGVGQAGNQKPIINYADMPQVGAQQPHEMGFGQSAPHVQPERATTHPNHAAASAVGYVQQGAPMPDAVITPAAQNAMAGAVNGVQLDKSGCPWDARIHASPPSINKGDEMWRSKKGVDKAQAEALSTELRRIASAGGNPTAAAPAGMPQANQAQFTPAPAPAQQQAAPVSTAFTEMMAQLAPHVASGAIPQTTIDEAARRVGAHNNGVGNVTLLQHNEALIPAFVAEVNKICAGQ